MTLSCSTQYRQHHYLGEALAVTVGGMLLIVEIDNLPIEAV